MSLKATGSVNYESPCILLIYENKNFHLSCAEMIIFIVLV